MNKDIELPAVSDELLLLYNGPFMYPEYELLILHQLRWVQEDLQTNIATTNLKNPEDEVDFFCRILALLHLQKQVSDGDHSEVETEYGIK